jgi:hypothetical protein
LGTDGELPRGVGLARDKKATGIGELEGFEGTDGEGAGWEGSCGAGGGGFGVWVGEEGAQFEVEEGAEVGEDGLVLHGFFGLGGVLWI